MQLFSYGKKTQPQFDLKKDFDEHISVDLVEEVTMKINSNGWIINHELNGLVVVRSNLRKVVRASLKFNKQLLFEMEQVK